MTSFSQRRSFTILMTLFATISGTAFGAYEVRGHSDQIADVIKIGALIGVVTIFASFVIWTLTHLKRDSVFRGGLAGLMTGLAIVPAPYFASGLKAEFLRLHALDNGGVVFSFLGAIPAAIQNGLVTFLLISKVSLVAVISSLILGVIISKRVPPRPHLKSGENLQTQK